MKKLLLLFLAIVGMAGTASAATNAYLYGSFQGIWDENDTNFPFTRISDSEFRILINSDWVNNNTVYFRFKVDGRNQGVSSNQEVTTNEYGAADSQTDGAFYISNVSNAGSKLVYIKIKYKNSGYGDKWHVSYYTRDAVDYNISFTKDNDSWGSTIKLYAWDSDGVKINGEWPGKGMTNNDGTYSYTLKVPNDGTNKMIFNDNGSNQYPTSDGLVSVNNGIYNTTGIAGVKTTVSSAGYATMCSNAALDYTSTSIKAYTASVNTTNGVVTLTGINKVPANTPVVLYKDGGVTEYIPVAASTDPVGTNDLLAGEGKAVSTNGGEGYYNYILNNVSGIGFYKAAGQTVATDRAYLHTTYNVEATPGARMTIVFADDEISGISELNANATSNNRYFDMQGRSVAQPKNGLYIMNGKKVIIK